MKARRLEGDGRRLAAGAPAIRPGSDGPGRACTCERLPISVGVWTGILSLIATILVAVVGFFGINGINDMRRIADEARRIEEIRTSMEKTQAQVEGIRDNITTSLTAASTNLEELRRGADQTLEEQQSAIEDFRSEVARSISTAEVQYSEVQDALEETRTEVRLAAEQVEDLLSDLENLQEALSRARGELEELNNS